MVYTHTHAVNGSKAVEQPIPRRSAVAYRWAPRLDRHAAFGGGSRLPWALLSSGNSIK